MLKNAGLLVSLTRTSGQHSTLQFEDPHDNLKKVLQFYVQQSIWPFLLTEREEPHPVQATSSTRPAPSFCCLIIIIIIIIMFYLAHIHVYT